MFLLFLAQLACIPDAEKLDGDGDGYGAALQGGDDCDDANAAVHPGAAERCDGVDEDCDAVVDNDAADAPSWYPDADGDQSGDGGGEAVLACSPPDGFVADIGDCDDSAPAVNPSAAEVCDEADNDCDAKIDDDDDNLDESSATTWYADADGDGHGAEAAPVSACVAPTGHVDDAQDCDDTDEAVSPAAVETCDDRDQDCDGVVDNDPTDPSTYYQDRDADGAGDSTSPTEDCALPEGYATNADDCDDLDAAVLPGALEVCNEVDDDCDGTVDGSADGSPASDALTWYIDADGDGDLAAPLTACDAPAGTVVGADDCDDSNNAVFPDAPEICGGSDDDCDGSIDEDAIDAPTWYTDLDADGFGVTPVAACEAPAGSADLGGDCDDTDSESSPGHDERCGGADEDCDGITDEDGAMDAVFRYLDVDGDTFGGDDVVASCAPVAGRVDEGGDCDDTDGDVFPGAEERCDGRDEDCDGEADEDAVDAEAFYADVDGDSFGVDVLTACTAPAGYVVTDGDCDDGEMTVFPGATEACDGADQDCDGAADEGFDADADGLADCFDTEQCDGLDNDGDAEIDEADAADAPTWYGDGDGDGYGDAAASTVACAAPAESVADATDCDDADPERSPGMFEVCGGSDEDCDGLTDEADATDAASWSIDGDGDGYGDVSAVTESCTAPSGMLAEGGDCDDGDPAIHPGVTETCDGVDSNCSGDEGDAAEATWWYADVDHDGYGDPDAGVSVCDRPAGWWSTDATDCDDEEDSGHLSNPGEDEECSDRRDNNCDGDDDPCRVSSATVGYPFSGTQNNHVGDTFSPAGDVDGDGRDDFWASDQFHDESGGTTPLTGAAFLMTGGRGTGVGFSYSGAAATLVGDRAYAEAGFAVAGGHDVNGDGVPDVLVSADPGGGEGEVFYVTGPYASGVSSLADAEGRIYTATPGDYLGYSLRLTPWGTASSVAMVLGAPNQDEGGAAAGSVYVFWTEPAGDTDVNDADLQVVGENAGDAAGFSLGAGDVTGDGVTDVVIGAPGQGDAGAVYVVSGDSSGLVDLRDAVVRITGAYAGDELGYAVASGGDVTGDGVDDVVAGAPGWYQPYESGIAYVMSIGVVPGVSVTTAATGSAYVSTPAARFGTYADIPGDLDLDGFADVIASAPLYVGSCSGTCGQAGLSYGPMSGQAVPDAEWFGHDSSAIGHAMVGVGDFNGDSYPDFVMGAEQRWSYTSPVGYPAYMFFGAGL